MAPQVCWPELCCALAALEAQPAHVESQLAGGDIRQEHARTSPLVGGAGLWRNAVQILAESLNRLIIGAPQEAVHIQLSKSMMSS